MYLFWLYYVLVYTLQNGTIVKQTLNVFVVKVTNTSIIYSLDCFGEVGSIF